MLSVQLIVEKGIGDGIDVTRREAYHGINVPVAQAKRPREVVVIPNCSKRRSRTIVGESGRNSGSGDPDFVVRGVRVLIAPVEEKLVFYNRQTHGSARGVAVQPRIFLIGRDVRVGVEEIGIGVEPVGSPMD